MERGLFSPEAFCEEYEHGEDFQSAGQHDEAEHPLPEGGHEVPASAVACDAGAESGVADA